MEINLDDWNKFPSQKTVYDDNDSEIILFSGGLGSGKSHVGVRKALKLSALNRGYPGGFLCPTYKDFKRDIRPLFQQECNRLGLREGKHWGFHKSDSFYWFCWTNAPLYIFSGEQPIAGPNLGYCLINEHSLILYQRIKEMLRRVRLKDAPYRQKCLFGTPEDIHGWLEDFVDIQQKLLETEPFAFNLIYADTSENTEIDPNYRRHLETMLDEQSLKVFASGQIGVKIGSDYFYYSYDDKKNVSEEAVQREGETIHVGLDFNVGNMAASFSHKVMGINGFEQHFFDELFLRGDSNTYTMARALLSRHPKNLMVITCDASGRNRSSSAQENLLNDVSILRSFGLNVRFKSANTRIRKRQLLVNGLLSNIRIKVHPKCRLIRKDFKIVKQDKATFEKVKDKDNSLTHFSDGIDYVIDYEYELPKDKVKKYVYTQSR